MSDYVFLFDIVKVLAEKKNSDYSHVYVYRVL